MRIEWLCFSYDSEDDANNLAKLYRRNCSLFWLLIAHSLSSVLTQFSEKAEHDFNLWETKLGA